MIDKNCESCYQQDFEWDVENDEPCKSCVGFSNWEPDIFSATKCDITRFEKIKAMTIQEMANVIVGLSSIDKYCKGKYSDQYGGNCPCNGSDEISCCIDWLNEIETEDQANE